jgi:hypothetical protein
MRVETIAPTSEAANAVRVSPDRRRLAVVRNATEIVVEPIGPGEPQSWLSVEPPARVVALSWSANGALAFVVRTERPGEDAPVPVPTIGHEVGVLTGPHVETRRVVGSALSWTPEGRALIVADSAHGVLERVGVLDAEREVLARYRDDDHPRFRPHVAVSGERVAFGCRRLEDSISEVWTVDRASGASLLTEIPGSQIYVRPVWSPKGHSLALWLVHLEIDTTGLVLVRQLEGEGEILYQSDCVEPSLPPLWTEQGILVARRAGEVMELAWIDPERRTLRSIGTLPEPAAADSMRLATGAIVIDGGSAAHVVLSD